MASRLSAVWCEETLVLSEYAFPVPFTFVYRFPDTLSNRNNDKIRTINLYTRLNSNYSFILVLTDVNM